MGQNHTQCKEKNWAVWICSKEKGREKKLWKICLFNSKYTKIANIKRANESLENAAQLKYLETEQHAVHQNGTQEQIKLTLDSGMLATIRHGISILPFAT